MPAPDREPPARALATWQRYCLYQVPGFVLVAVLSALAAQWFSLPLWMCVSAVLLWVAKDAALYPMLKSSYRTGDPTGPASLVGSLGTVQDALDPVGMVKIGAELWKAKATSPTAAGEEVRVVGNSGMTLLVEARQRESEAGRSEH